MYRYSFRNPPFAYMLSDFQVRSSLLQITKNLYASNKCITKLVHRMQAKLSLNFSQLHFIYSN